MKYYFYFLMLVSGVFSCKTEIREGYFTCNPNEPGTCPAGWVCQLRGTDGVHRCYARAEAWCGNGMRDPGEVCDGLDMGDFSCENAYSLCLSNCTAMCTECGNGRIELNAAGVGEECDDGNTESGDGCSADCHIEKAYCQDPGENCLQWCGDGIINGPELCEPSNLGGYSCTDFDYQGGQLRCSADCRELDFSACDGYCGDGVLQESEACDGMVMPASTCRDFLYTGGTLGCSTSCQLRQDGCFSSWQRQTINTTGNVMAIHETADGALFAVSFSGWAGVLEQGVWRQWQLLKDPMLRTVFAFSSNNAWAGGNSGALYHFDGAGWNNVEVDENLHITGIWASAPDDVYVCGFTSTNPSNAVVLHYDGGEWTNVLALIDFMIPYTFMAIHGMAPDDVWVVGSRGQVWHYDGDAWRQVVLPAGMEFWDFRFVTSVGSARLFAGYTDASEGFILREENGAFELLPISTSSRVLQVRGLSEEELWALLENGSVLRREPGGWRTLSPPVSNRVYSLWVTSKNTLWTGGASGLLYHYVGEFETLGYAFPQTIMRIWGPKPGELYVAGQTGALHHLAGGVWQAETPGLVVQDIWGPDENTVFAVGNNGQAAIRLNGVWTLMETGVTTHLRAVHGCGANDVWAVGMFGTILHYTDGVWTNMTGPLTTEIYNDVYCVSNEAVFLVGNDGVAKFYNGVAWMDLPTNIGKNLNAVWASSGRHAYAVGNDGLILFFDGSSWTSVPSGGGLTLRDIDGLHSRDLWVAGTGGVMLHYDGVRFSPVNVPGNPALTRVHVQADRVVAAAGSSILEYRYHHSLPPYAPGPCPGAVPLYCHDTRVFDTHNMPARIESWGAAGGLSGPETAFLFQAPFAGQYTWTMYPSSPYARIAVLARDAFDACENASALHVSTLVNGSQVVSLHLERNETVAVVIDSAIPESGLLQLKCVRQ